MLRRILAVGLTFAVSTALVQSSTWANVDGVPMCSHDTTKWHPLVERNSDGSIACTYGHEHGSDPIVLDKVFGSLNDQVGQEISYPWHTANENDDKTLPLTTGDGRPIAGGKHRFYKWEVITAGELEASGKSVCETPYAPYSFDNIRMEVHADGNAGAMIRFHSFYVEAETCDPNDPTYHGIIRIGGHFDYGHLQGLENTPQGKEDVIIPLPGIDPSYDTSQRRIHGTAGGSCDGCSGAFRGDFTWYGASNTQEFQTAPAAIHISDGIREQDWGPIDPQNPNGPVQFYDKQGGATYNHGAGVPIDILGAIVPDPGLLPGAIVHADNTFDWTGYVDRHDNVVANCAEVSVDCIPVRLENVKPGAYQYANDDSGRQLPMVNRDVVGPDGNSLIQFPN